MLQEEKKTRKELKSDTCDRCDKCHSNTWAVEVVRKSSNDVRARLCSPCAEAIDEVLRNVFNRLVLGEND